MTSMVPQKDQDDNSNFKRIVFGGYWGLSDGAVPFVGYLFTDSNDLQVVKWIYKYEFDEGKAEVVKALAYHS